ncbi:hypothetical protein [Rhodococcus triatomae]
MGKKFARGVVLAVAVAGFAAAATGGAQAVPAAAPGHGPSIVCWNAQPGILASDTGIPCTTASGMSGYVHIW